MIHGTFSTSLKSIKPPALRTSAEVSAIISRHAQTFIPPITGTPIFDRIRTLLIKRGGNAGIRMFSRILTSVEQIKATPLSKKELLDGFVTYGVFLNDEEQSSLLAQVNANERGQIALGTFLTALRGVMSPQRAEFVVQIYDVMYGAAVNSVVTFEDMMKSFCPAQHPEVLCGNKTARQMIVEFQQAWNKTGSDRVSYEEFAEYFEDLSAAIENDDYFEMLVSNTWGLTNLCHNNFSSIAFRSQG